MILGVTAGAAVGDNHGAVVSVDSEARRGAARRHDDKHRYLQLRRMVGHSHGEVTVRGHNHPFPLLLLKTHRLLSSLWSHTQQQSGWWGLWPTGSLGHTKTPPILQNKLTENHTFRVCFVRQSFKSLSYFISSQSPKWLWRLIGFLSLRIANKWNPTLHLVSQTRDRSRPKLFQQLLLWGAVASNNFWPWRKNKV